MTIDPFVHHWLTPREIADRYDRSATTIHNWIYDGTLADAGFIVLQFTTTLPGRRPYSRTWIRLNTY